MPPLRVMLATSFIFISIVTGNAQFIKTFQLSGSRSLETSNERTIKNSSLPHYHIAILIPGWDAGIDSIIDGFQDSLNNQNVFTASFKRYNPDGNRVLLRSQAEDIFISHYDLIYSIGTEPTKMLKE